MEISHRCMLPSHSASPPFIHSSASLTSCEVEGQAEQYLKIYSGLCEKYFVKSENSMLDREALLC